MKRLIPISILFSVFLTQCARETVIDLPEEEPKIVVNCHFKPGSPFYIELSRSQSVFNGDPFETINKADVTIAIEGQFWNRLKFKYDTLQDRYLWVSKDEALPGVLYTLTVRVPTDENASAEATSSIPPSYGLLPMKTDSATTRVVRLPDSSFALRVPIALSLKFLPEEKRFFAFNFTHETEVFRTVNGQQVSDYTYSTNSSFTTDGRTLSLLNDISDAEPVVLVNEKYWSDDAKTLYLDAIIPFVPGRETPKWLFVEWRTLSEEFYRYHLSLARQGGTLPLTDPDAVFNNVTNGYGTFSGYSVERHSIKLPVF